MSDSTMRTLSGASGHQIFSETPSGTINGSNTVFTLSQTPVNGSLAIYLNGARQKLTDDYTLSTATITFISAPPSGSNIICDYEY